MNFVPSCNIYSATSKSTKSKASYKTQRKTSLPRNSLITKIINIMRSFLIMCCVIVCSIKQSFLKIWIKRMASGFFWIKVWLRHWKSCIPNMLKYRQKKIIQGCKHMHIPAYIYTTNKVYSDLQSHNMCLHTHAPVCLVVWRVTYFKRRQCSKSL